MSPTTLSSATASIASRSSWTRRSSATARSLVLVRLHDLLVGDRLLLLPLCAGSLDHLLAAVLLEDDLLTLARGGEARGLLETLEPVAQVPVLLLEFVCVRGERRVGLPPVDPHLLRPLD